MTDTLVSQRMAACPLEVRSAAAERTNSKVTAWLSTQVPHRDHHGLCPVLGMDPHELRIVAKEGFELAGWALIGLMLWDVGLARRPHRVESAAAAEATRLEPRSDP